MCACLVHFVDMLTVLGLLRVMQLILMYTGVWVSGHCCSYFNYFWVYFGHLCLAAWSDLFAFNLFFDRFSFRVNLCLIVSLDLRGFRQTLHCCMRSLLLTFECF